MKKVTKQWTTRDGTKIHICDMDDSHLKNTIAMLDRLHQKKISAAYSVAATLRGEMATLFAEQDIDRMESEGTSSSYPIYDDLCTERDRRGL